MTPFLAMTKRLFALSLALMFSSSLSRSFLIPSNFSRYSFLMSPSWPPIINSMETLDFDTSIDITCSWFTNVSDPVSSCSVGFVVADFVAFGVEAAFGVSFIGEAEVDWVFIPFVLHVSPNGLSRTVFLQYRNIPIFVFSRCSWNANDRDTE